MPDALGLPLANPVVDRLAIIGCGLIGSSLLRVARRKNIAGAVIACDESAFVRARVSELALADEVHENPATAVRDADIVILCIPVGANGAVASKIEGALKPGSILSDVGSVKGAVFSAVAEFVPPGVHFIPAHPVAGTEQSGPDAGFATLFLNRWCILTPPETVDASALERLSAFWLAPPDR